MLSAMGTVWDEIQNSLWLEKKIAKVSVKLQFLAPTAEIPEIKEAEAEKI